MRQSGRHTPVSHARSLCGSGGLRDQRGRVCEWPVEGARSVVAHAGSRDRATGTAGGVARTAAGSGAAGEVGRGDGGKDFRGVGGDAGGVGGAAAGVARRGASGGVARSDDVTEVAEDEVERADREAGREGDGPDLAARPAGFFDDEVNDGAAGDAEKDAAGGGVVENRVEVFGDARGVGGREIVLGEEAGELVRWHLVGQRGELPALQREFADRVVFSDGEGGGFE
jgi:hypothetical protein